jgi:hypothetical protein
MAAQSWIEPAALYISLYPHVTHHADDPDSGSDSVSMSLILHSSSPFFHSSRLVFALLIMYHSCSLIRSFGFHMFLMSFPFHSKAVQLYILPVFVLLVSSLGIDLISGSLSPLVLSVIPDTRPPFCSSS